MNGASVLLLGVGLGLSHAADADHLVAVTTLLKRDSGSGRAARIAALWGAGHAAAFFAVGLLIVHAGVRPPRLFDQLTEVLVACMLIGIGLWQLWSSSRPPASEPPSSRSSGLRPILVGLVHGLAGSAGIALLAASTIPSRALATIYLCLFGVGTVAGMVALTFAISRALIWTQGRGRLDVLILRAAALFSAALGVSVLVSALSS